MVRSAVVAVLLVLILVLFPAVSVRAAGSVGDDQADVVWGQPNMTSNAGNNGGISSTSLNQPIGSTVDSSGNLWVADTLNNRVLMFPAGSATATKVFGQSSFTSGATDDGQSGPVAYGLYFPIGIAVDANGTLFVADDANQRVLVFYHAASKVNGASADLVLGQPNFTSATLNNSAMVNGTSCLAFSSANACTLFDPQGLSIDSNGDLLVADAGNNRVLLYPAAELAPSNPDKYTCSSSCVIPATMVWGQYGSFLTNGQNQAHTQGTDDPCLTTSGGSGNPTNCTLQNPFQAVADAQGNLYIADAGNHRVLEYDEALTTGTTTYAQAATMVYGQGGSFTSSAADLGGVTASSLNQPEGIAIDPAGDLWVADFYNNRVLEFSTPVTSNRSAATTAIGVLGQRGLFTSNVSNSGGVNGGALWSPDGLTFDASGNAYVTDQDNNRVLEFLQPYPISARIGLAAGWNLLALPSTTALPYSAASVVSQVNGEGGNVSEVAVYANGRYQVFVPGYATDFAITPKEGFWVLATTSSTWGMT